MHLGRVAAREQGAVTNRDAEALVQRTTQHADGLRRRSPHVPDAEPAVVARGDEPRVGEPRHARHAWCEWPRSAFCAARQRASHISIEPSCAPVAAVSLRTSMQFSATEQLPLNRSSSVAASQIFVAWSQEHVQS